MMSSKGRDKVFALAQYLVELYIKCMASSKLYKKEVKLGQIESVRLAKLVKNNISSGRKVFKFLKFVDEYRILQNAVQDIKPKKILSEQ